LFIYKTFFFFLFSRFLDGSTSIFATVIPKSVLIGGQLQASKAYGAAVVAPSDTTTISVTVTNPYDFVVSDVAFMDVFAGSVVGVASTETISPSGSAATGGCDTATLALALSDTRLDLSAATIPAMTTCIYSVTITAPALAGTYDNVAFTVSATGVDDTMTDLASLVVSTLIPPTVTKAFEQSSVVLNTGTTTMTITVAAPVENGLTGVSFTDVIPAGLTITPTTVTAGTGCLGSGDTSSTTATQVVVSGYNVAAGTTCTFAVQVQGTALGTQTNEPFVVTSDTPDVTGGGAFVNVVDSALFKTFGGTNMQLSGTTSLTITVLNTEGSDLTNVNFVDNLPLGLTIDGTPVASSGCTTGFAFTTTSISVTAGTIPFPDGCTYSAVVQGDTQGLKTNPVISLTSTQQNLDSAPVSVFVLAPPTVTKAFGVNSLSVDGTTSLTVTIANPNAIDLENVAFTDPIPVQVTTTNMLVVSPAGCTGASFSAPNLIVAAGVVPASTTCVYSLTVDGATSTVGGPYENPSFSVVSDAATVSSAPDFISIVDIATPSVVKSFSASPINVGDPLSLTIAIMNNDLSDEMTGVSFTDPVPAGVAVGPLQSSNGCGGALPVVSGQNNIVLSGGTIAANTNCVYVFSLTSPAFGDEFVNPAFTVSSDLAPQAVSSPATLLVVEPPVVSQAYQESVILAGESTFLRITVSNPNTVNLTGSAFTFPLPNDRTIIGSVVTTGNGCGTGTISNSATSISVSSEVIPTKTSCVYTVEVTGVVPGTETNDPIVVTASNSNPSLPSNTPSLEVQTLSTPTVVKAFGAAKINPGDTPTVDITITNTGGYIITGVNFSDPVPLNIVPAATPVFIRDPDEFCYIGTLAYDTGTGVFSLSGGEIPGNFSCTYSMEVSGTVPGVYINPGFQVFSNNSNPSALSDDADIEITTVLRPTASKVISPDPIVVGTDTIFTISILNNDVAALMNVAFTDEIPAGLTPTGAFTTGADCGAVDPMFSGNTVSVSGAVIPFGATCIYELTVTGTVLGDYSNPEFVVLSDGPDAISAAATVTVIGPPTVSQNYDGNTFW
jgi:uncharacterized repeat protein (TIGR01451 family)